MYSIQNGRYQYSKIPEIFDFNIRLVGRIRADEFALFLCQILHFPGSRFDSNRKNAIDCMYGICNNCNQTLYDISGFEGLEILKVCMEYQQVMERFIHVIFAGISASVYLVLFTVSVLFYGKFFLQISS